MDRDEKIAFMRQFLGNRSVNSNVVIPEEGLLELYEPIAIRIESMEAAAPEPLGPDIDRAERFKVLEDVFSLGCKLIKGSPPTIDSVDGARLNSRLLFWKRDRELNQYPGCDYLSRPIDSPTDNELTGWITAGREKLQAIVQSFLPDFNVADSTAVEAKIKELKITLKTTREAGKDTIAKQILILNDLNKVNQLSPMRIPLDDGTSVQYCKLAEAAGGVTEKISLVSRTLVATQLPNLIALEGLTFDNYLDHRDHFKLSTQAIIKLPKHGKILEVQREAMALNISRMLNLDTTRSTMIAYNGQPALFVPFEDIRLLKEFATGKTLKAKFLGSGEYSHYSTINPVGQGLHLDEFINDFGNTLGIFYLCSDTDAMGGYNQNKALRGNNLFMYDQVIMDAEKLGLDSRLSMQPTRAISKHTRHDQGRNRTLIEDSSMEEKFASLMQLKERKAILVQYFARVAFQHQLKREDLRKELETQPSPTRAKELNEQITMLTSLLGDALLLSNKVKGRIDAIDKILPKNPENLEISLVRQTLVLEKLLNNPVLFSDDGRPFRNPWTNRHSLNAEGINPVPGRPGFVSITFNNDVSPDNIAMIKRYSGHDTLEQRSRRELIIHQDHLRALSETMCFPEHSSQYNPAANYLNLQDLSVIGSGYQIGHRGRILNTINAHQEMLISTAPIPEKLAHMAITEAQLKEYISTAQDKGFGLHVLKKFAYDMHKQMLNMIPLTDRSAQLTNAFNAAAKLDQLSNFNEVVRTAILHNKVNDPCFTAFLQSCIDKSNQAHDHMGAKLLSTALQQEAAEVLISLKLIEQQVDEDLDLESIDPRGALETRLLAEQSVFSQGIETFQAERVVSTREEGPSADMISTI
jgi:hypothetical protein